jgi:membrane-associated phospholipid phosphatase
VVITSIPIEARRIFAACLLTACSFSTSQALASEKYFAAPDADSGAAAQVDLNGIRPNHLWTFDYLKLVFGDTKAVLTAPTSWGQEDWRNAGIAFAAVGATAAFDRTIRTHVQANRTAGKDRFMKRWQDINTFYILGGFEAWGELGGDVRAKNVAMDGLAASLIASGLITPSLKFVVGRERPNTTSATFKFRPFSGNYSFPSGHATQAFAVATAVAENYPTWWVEGLAYGSAALVGYARIEQNAHYASDVVAGSLIGWSVARAIVHRNNGPVNPRKLNWSPYTSSSGSGIIFFKAF